MKVINLVGYRAGWVSDIRSKLQIRRRFSLLKLTISMRSRRPIVGDAAVVVCLTSYGERIQNVHYTIQSIAEGVCRPKRIILWISHSDAHLLTPQISSLQGRGLEVRPTEDYGPHKKYYPYCLAAVEAPDAALPLVTADDDVLYPAHWLSDLISAAATESYPVIVAHRAHRIKVENGAIGPYTSWGIGSGTANPSYANIATGVCGVLYPRDFILQITRIWNTEFMEFAQFADDLWLHSRSVLLGIPTKQVNHQESKIMEHHPDIGTSLSLHNVIGGNNDTVAREIYTPELVAKVQSSCVQGG